MKLEICPKCGQILQDWAHVVCHNCARIENEERRYHGGRRVYCTYADLSIMPGIQGLSNDVFDSDERGSPDADKQMTEIVHQIQLLLKGFRALLQDLYFGRPYQLSFILLERGTPKAVIDQWANDPQFLLQAWEKLVELLCEELATALPALDPHVLVYAMASMAASTTLRLMLRRLVLQWKHFWQHAILSCCTWTETPIALF